MSNRILYKTITSPDDFKNPIYCYIVIRQLEYRYGESFEDCGGHWPSGNEVLDWLYHKGYITDKQHMKINLEKTWWGSPTEFLFGYGKFSLMEHGECTFPAYSKGYQLMCEYISEHEKERSQLYEVICIENGTLKYSPPTSLSVTELVEYYKANDGQEPPEPEYFVNEIYQDDIDTGTVTKEKWLKDGGCNGTSYSDEYNFLKDMSIAEADYHAKYEDQRVQVSVIERHLNFYRNDHDLDIKYVICNSTTYQKIKENSINYFPNKEEDKIKILRDSQEKGNYRFAICNDLKDDEIELR